MNLFHWTGRFMIGIITVGLVLLISVQIMMEFDQTREYLEWAETKLGIVRLPEAQEVAVYVPEESVTLKLLNSGNYSTARVLVNNQRAYTFDKSVLQIPVEDGDLLILDTRGIDEALWFEVMGYSEVISSVQKREQFRVRNGMQVIQIEFKHGEKY